MNTGLEFPVEMFEQYLKNVKAESVNDLVVVSIEKILKLAFEDYKKEQLSFDLFSSICEKLWTRITQIKQQNTELGAILDYGTELSWYIRNDTTRARELLDKINEFVDKLD